MRCLRCGTEGASALYCTRCGHRLFAWLGDPLGAMELTGLSSAAAATPRTSSATTAAKVILGVCAVLLASYISSAWAAILLIAFLVVFWRWPRIGWRPWSIFLGGVLLLAALSHLAAKSL